MVSLLVRSDRAEGAQTEIRAPTKREAREERLGAMPVLSYSGRTILTGPNISMGTYDTVVLVAGS